MARKKATRQKKVARKKATPRRKTAPRKKAATKRNPITAHFEVATLTKGTVKFWDGSAWTAQRARAARFFSVTGAKGMAMSLPRKTAVVSSRDPITAIAAFLGGKA